LGIGCPGQTIHVHICRGAGSATVIGRPKRIRLVCPGKVKLCLAAVLPAAGALFALKIQTDNPNATLCDRDYHTIAIAAFEFVDLT
jgi:hypothetical protein